MSSAPFFDDNDWRKVFLAPIAQKYCKVGYHAAVALSDWTRFSGFRLRAYDLNMPGIDVYDAVAILPRDNGSNND